MRHVQRSGGTAVLLVPDSTQRAAVVEGLRCGGVEVAAAVANVDAAMVLLEEHRPDVLIAEVDLPGGSGAALCMIASAVRRRPELTAIVLSATADRATLEDAFDAGASAFILTTSSRSALPLALRLAVAESTGTAQATTVAHVTSTADSAGEAPRLTRREREILRLVSEGRSNRDVGRVLWVSDQTVKFHLANVYRKLGVGSRYEAAQAAREHGLLEPVSAADDGVHALATSVSREG
jgi:DNA-binding NarL/FixJ family response regulator